MCVCISFHFYSVIQQSHPVCNTIMLFGIIICLLSVILLGIDGRFVSPSTYPKVWLTNSIYKTKKLVQLFSTRNFYFFSSSSCFSSSCSFVCHTWNNFGHGFFSFRMQICQTRAWMLSTGFTLAYGAMFSKVWRVHRFTTKQKSDPKVRKSKMCCLSTI